MTAPDLEAIALSAEDVYMAIDWGSPEGWDLRKEHPNTVASYERMAKRIDERNIAPLRKALLAAREELARVRRETLLDACKAMCEGCAEGSPMHAEYTQYHVRPSDARGPWHDLCRAWPIRSLLAGDGGVA